MNTEFEFEQYLDFLITSELGCGQMTWSELLRRLPGVTPNVVLDSVKRQNLSARIQFISDGDGHTGCTAVPKACEFWKQGLLPTPHLLDACWWFSDSSLTLLTERVLESKGTQIALLGAPTLFHSLRQMKQPVLRLTLVDADGDINAGSDIEDHRFVVGDLLRDELPKVGADVVVADPPWYEPEMRSFLWAARSVCKTQGLILLSVPPEGTRPGIANEWDRLLQWANDIGLKLVSYEKAALSYLSPPFEQNALAKAGVNQMTEEWRRGDLATFYCEGACCHERPDAPDRQAWVECSVDGVRFRVRAPEAVGWSDPSLHPLALDDVLPSVSRRNPLRQSVDVWTSGNRIFKCAGRQVLVLILHAIACGKDPVSVVQSKLAYSLQEDSDVHVLQVATKLCQIIAREKQENARIRQRHEKLEFIAD